MLLLLLTDTSNTAVDVACAVIIVTGVYTLIRCLDDIATIVLYFFLMLLLLLLVFGLLSLLVPLCFAGTMHAVNNTFEMHRKRERETIRKMHNVQRFA